MAHRQLHGTSEQAMRRTSPLVVVAVCLMVVGWSVPLMAQQGLKIRLLSAEDDTWNQTAQEMGAEVLTPPGEAKEPTTSSVPKMLPAPKMSSATNMSPTPEVLPPSVLKKEMPGYLSGTEPRSTADEAAGQPLLLDQEEDLYQEPAFEAYDEQRRFQRSLFGIREHLLSIDPDEVEDVRQAKGVDGYRAGPERVWRFSPFSRMPFFDGRFRGRFRERFRGRFLGRIFRPGSNHDTPFAKLFPWNRTPGRNQGVGEPLVNDSWRWAPFGAGWFVGMMDGTTLVTDWTGAKTGYFGGYHANWDFDHYWGVEFRYGVASLPQWDNMLLYDTGTHGLPDARFGKRHAMLKYGDFSFLYFPWGDSKWRPYARAGIGWGYVKFTDLNYKLWSNSTMTMPVGIGLKYRYSRRLVFRTELVDNFLFGERGINPQHNLSFTAGIEIRFGGARKAYWPYNPGRHYW